ncbi:class I SAM-dependent methyltransferase [Porticoccus sp. W117]|uniref:class I SAM-dependent methyltransferase n=1 Tax=Porticoccus sp. W117 TaxID=3054777 RepID=UPI0025985A42|nr:class I SAM-dependent methyltransferase [Porticoccus sp. W117]MDM3869841.1 class I SAM-dependent methyltransferase [Porticoccus sp. W117]
MSQPTNNGGSWVKESRFGVWFLGTDTWIVHVLTRALNNLESLYPLKEREFSVILDIGYGHGHSLKLLDERYSPNRLIGVDVDPKAEGRAKANIGHCRSQVETHLCDAAALPLPDQSVDMLFCHQTFHHLVDHERAIQEFYRVLKPGGVMLFAESCKRYIHSLMIRLLFRHPMDVQKTDDEYVALIRGAGFEVPEEQISRPYLWWSREDLGLFEKFGFKVPEDREETLINLVAMRPE